MGLDDSSEPPKKKLKQAQLPFCNQQMKSNKRKCSVNTLEDNKESFKKVCSSDELDCGLVNKENVITINESEGSGSISKEDSKNIKNEDCTANNSKALISMTIDNKRENNKVKQIQNLDPVSNNDENKVNDDGMDVEVSEKKEEETLNESKSGVYEIEESDDEKVSTSFSHSSDDEKTDETRNKVTSPQDPLENTSKRKLTPKALEKKRFRESLKQEKLEQKMREKEAKLKSKLEKEEQKRKEKEEKEEQKRKEKEEKERKKMEEIKQKEEEKRKKEEAKEEEKRLKEEEKRRRDEAKEEEKKKKEGARILEQKKEDQARKAFTNYFILKKTKTDITEAPDVDSQPKFMPFPVKPDMRLAVGSRRQISEKDKLKLDEYLMNKDHKKSYLNELKKGEHIPLKSESTWPLSEELHDVIIIESAVDGEEVHDLQEENKKPKRNFKKAKLLQFHENRRPAYWGTWRKKSKNITPRQPFLKDECLNYEVDSDSEWEDEGEGEDIDNDDSDKEHSDEENCEEKDENGYILDNTFVPHGYLSDEEVHPDEENFDPEDQKLRLKVLKKEFEEEMKMKTERLKPRILGCVWISNDTTAVSKGSLYETLMDYRAVWDEDNGSIKVTGPVLEESPTVPTSSNKPFSKAVMNHLVTFVNGNHMPFLVMVQEFRNIMEKENYPAISKRALSMKIKEIASKEYDENGKHLWSVNSELCHEFGVTPLAQLNSSNGEKSKDKFLENFLKRPSTSPQQTSKNLTPAPLLSTKPASTFPVPNQSILQPPNTPVPSTVKKRATLITLPHTPTNIIKDDGITKPHKDTPRPMHPFIKNLYYKQALKKENRMKTSTSCTDDAVIDLIDDEVK